ncbi:hypothetical protein GCM10010116_27960 [Microbispora rosea subsp. aerata]|nr:hypothetical protein GCM10010116_27960 [Microbispora rosea subsp. aerata]GIH53929.1 hypothetical protein Mro02_08430 [Microbispora rosea subsp. aerata]GLJ84902.1 hypothetical protein GCM10017588_36300 [Microbispora rosea subsp. aerata]
MPPKPEKSLAAAEPCPSPQSWNAPTSLTSESPRHPKKLANGPDKPAKAGAKWLIWEVRKGNQRLRATRAIKYAVSGA